MRVDRMGGVKIGDIVARKSYGNDIFFRVSELKSNGKETIATLKGISYRIEADAPVSDLEVQSRKSVKIYRLECDKALMMRAK